MAKKKAPRGKPFTPGNTVGVETRFKPGENTPAPDMLKMLENDLRKGLLSDASWEEGLFDYVRKRGDPTFQRKETRDEIKPLLLLALQKSYVTGTTRNRIRRLYDAWDRNPNYRTPEEPKPVVAATPAPVREYRIPTEQERAEQQKAQDERDWQASAILTREHFALYRQSIHDHKIIVFQLVDGRFIYDNDEISASTVRFITNTGNAIVIWLKSPGRGQSIIEATPTTVVWKAAPKEKESAPPIESPASMLGVSESAYPALHRELNSPQESKVLPHQIPNRTPDAFSAGIKIKPWGSPEAQKRKEKYEVSQTGASQLYFEAQNNPKQWDDF